MKRITPALAVFISVLALLVSVGANVTTYKLASNESAHIAKAVEENHVALCGIIDDSYAGALRRQAVLNTADKLLALVKQLPPGVAHDAVLAVEQAFRRSGTGSPTARKALNKELSDLGCKTRVE